MKSAVCFLLALMCLTAIVNAQRKDCPTICPAVFDPKCGFNGRCYRQFSNNCQLLSASCKSPKAFTPVDNAMCQEASKRKGLMGAC